ncbi:hypothetical protein JB92DRAFT_3102613 [Gautieria morchelliformis]|nr:hypothetical protein JB92DRAFT_3102613 [Gautieria morchelliformis]
MSHVSMLSNGPTVHLTPHPGTESNIHPGSVTKINPGEVTILGRKATTFKPGGSTRDKDQTRFTQEIKMDEEVIKVNPWRGVLVLTPRLTLDISSYVTGWLQCTPLLDPLCGLHNMSILGGTMTSPLLKIKLDLPGDRSVETASQTLGPPSITWYLRTFKEVGMNENLTWLDGQRQVNSANTPPLLGGRDSTP